MRIDEILRRLEGLPLADMEAAALAEAGETLAAAVREALAVRPGGGHERPWVETGALHDSIGAVAGGDMLMVGSSDPVAVDQEHGTRTVPPRPFLGPVAGAMGEAVAAAIGARFADVLKSVR
jgi:hypothetical protein